MLNCLILYNKMMLYFFRILKNFVKYFSDGKVIMDKRIKLVIRLVLIFGGTVIGILLGLRLAIYFAPFYCFCHIFNDRACNPVSYEKVKV